MCPWWPQVFMCPENPSRRLPASHTVYKGAPICIRVWSLGWLASGSCCCDQCVMGACALLPGSPAGCWCLLCCQGVGSRLPFKQAGRLVWLLDPLHPDATTAAATACMQCSPGQTLALQHVRQGAWLPPSATQRWCDHIRQRAWGSWAAHCEHDMAPTTAVCLCWQLLSTRTPRGAPGGTTW